MKKLDLRSVVIGILMTVIFFLLIGQTDVNKEGYFKTLYVDDIIVKGTMLVRDKGTDKIYIGSDHLGGGSIEIYNKHDARVIALRPTSDEGGAIYLYDKNGMISSSTGGFGILGVSIR